MFAHVLGRREWTIVRKNRAVTVEPGILFGNSKPDTCLSSNTLEHVC